LNSGEGYLVTGDTYYSSLTVAKAVIDQGKHHFLFSCKANYLFKQHTLPHVKVKGDSAWTSSKKRLLMETPMSTRSHST
jgi:hypothetical protein